MRHLAIVLALVAALGSASSAQPPRAREIDNLAAFARLYGVVRFFYPGDGAAGLDWQRFAVAGVARVRAAGDLAGLEAALKTLFAPLGPGIEIGATLTPAPPAGPPDRSLVAWRHQGPGLRAPANNFTYISKRTNRTVVYMPSGAISKVEEPFEGPPSPAGAHVDVDLGSGSKARVPLALTPAQAAIRLDPAFEARVQPLVASGGADLDTAVADVVVAWNVYRHFYPYLREVASDAKVEWDHLLGIHLGRMLESDAASRRDVLAGLVADARDGHGRVSSKAADSRGWLPVFLQEVEGKVVIAATGAGGVPLGAVVVSLDGAALEARVRHSRQLVSGTPQWKTSRALLELARCAKGTNASMTIDAGAGPRTVSMPCGDQGLQREKRPAPVTELLHGAWYVDLTRAKWEAIVPVLPRLAQARGVVFDVRGYPTDAGFQLLPHLLAEKEDDLWMHIDLLNGPFQQVYETRHIGWHCRPKPPRVGGTVVFLTDGRAISYAESVLGYIKDRKLGLIIGGATAGANGNVTSFDVPSGSTISFTGMRVTRHDGTSQHHLIGILPDVPLTPTIAGLRAGKDELLERAVARIQRP